MAIKLLFEGLGLGFLLYLICAIGICRGAVGMVHLYSEAVQKRTAELGLTSSDEIRRRSLVFKGLCIPGYLIYVSCNERCAKLMRKTWLKEAGIPDVSAFFSLENEKELAAWSNRFSSVTAKSYMRGYRDIYRDIYKNEGLFHKLMIRFCDSLVRMKIIKINFGV